MLEALQVHSLHYGPPPPPPPPPSLVMRAKPFFRTFMELLVGVIFFRQDLKTPYIKNSECDSQAKKKKKIPIVVSTISHFWFPAIANLWQSVFASLFSMVYTTLTTNIFLWGTNFFFFHVVQLGAEKVSNLFETFCIGGT